jgi:hypothetical protein
MRYLLPPKMLLMKSSGPPLELSDEVLAGAVSGRGRGIGTGPFDAMCVIGSVCVAGAAGAAEAAGAAGASAMT